MTEKTMNTFDIPRIGHPFNSFNLCLVHFNSPLGNLVSKNYPFINHEMALLPIEHQICFFTSLQNFIKIVETVVKGVSIDGNVVHENFYNLLTETMKYCRHTPLKSSRCITRTKRHTLDGWRIVDGCSLFASPTMVPEISFSPLVGYPKWKV